MNKVKCLQQERICSIVAKDRARRQGRSSSDQDVTVSELVSE
jgi:hypothetical protein